MVLAGWRPTAHLRGSNRVWSIDGMMTGRGKLKYLGKNMPS